MSKPSTDPLMTIRPAPDPLAHALGTLLAEPLAQAWQAPEPPAALRERLTDRLAAARLAEAAMFTVRRRSALRHTLAPGVTAQTLYRAKAGQPLRPGEPLGATLIELAAGTSFDPATLNNASLHREWLLLSRSAMLGGESLSQRDYHVTPAGHASAQWSSAGGALLFLRESDLPAQQGDQPLTVRDAEAGWPEFVPGIRRRVLWQRDGQAALLYFAEAGAQVPHHRHGHDEECLMVQGELFLDDILLQTGDYQLAPAGSGHTLTETDTGVVIYAHGDLDLQFV
ncbi:cupin domain-containing protein [Roseateles toxinivorans]|uniref:ChrR-like protein with cupin domain n=1 Tax=Roseateles toxinivorans TaxID=270368 RepID=A0A4R6QNC9_9BURK|nr:cupin domain-containing protein [Roseateles toxinivorans]TDP63971.1 ChrR-like protein with cupin domain [Roseateles toxinivorans]